VSENDPYRTNTRHVFVVLHKPLKLPRTLRINPRDCVSNERVLSKYHITSTPSTVHIVNDP
jgi:hypothetical protein